jgi:HlyD family secretion protein
MRVQAAVDEADIGRVKEGQTATFTVDAYPEETFTGRVEQVRLQPTLTQNVVTYDVVLRVPNDDLRLMPGMTANLTITVSAAENVLHVPAAALRFSPPGARPRAAGEGRDARARGPRVFVLEGGKPRAVPVTPGLSDGSRTEVSGDVRAGMQVITGVVSDAPAAQAGGAPFGMQQRPRGGGGGGGGGGRR